MKTHQLRWLAGRFSKRNNKWFAALEQSGISASNFLFSLLIVRFAGVADLGVYSFWFVACQFMAMLTNGLATRQMVLQFSSETFSEQCRGISLTCRIAGGLQVGQALLLASLIMFHPPAGNAFVLWLALVTYSTSINFAELYRQYYYLRSRQRMSLWFSGMALAAGTLGFIIFLFSGLIASPELSAFWFLALSNIGFVILAHQAIKPNKPNARVMLADIVEVCRNYWAPGLPATGGMLVTWMQNQSVTPMLMFMFGPLSVGYYSLAKMIVTPVNMVTTGLAKSALPQIRRAFGAGDNESLNVSVKGHCKTSMRIVYWYIAFIGVIWIVGRLAGKINTSDALVILFVNTVLVMALSNYRFWISQGLVVRSRFGILLKLGIVASALTVAMMLGGGQILNSAAWVVFAPAIGEVFLIIVLSRSLKKIQAE